MTDTLKITCDSCGADLTATEATPRFRLRLVAEQLPIKTMFRHLVHVPAPFEGQRHFCGKTCLKAWNGK